jgi:hypothetical protein
VPSADGSTRRPRRNDGHDETFPSHAEHPGLLAPRVARVGETRIRNYKSFTIQVRPVIPDPWLTQRRPRGAGAPAARERVRVTVIGRPTWPGSRDLPRGILSCLRFFASSCSARSAIATSSRREHYNVRSSAAGSILLARRDGTHVAIAPMANSTTTGTTNA